jgi:hypothetical protein
VQCQSCVTCATTYACVKFQRQACGSPREFGHSQLQLRFWFTSVSTGTAPWHSVSDRLASVQHHFQLRVRRHSQLQLRFWFTSVSAGTAPWHSVSDRLASVQHHFQLRVRRYCATLRRCCVAQRRSTGPLGHHCMGLRYFIPVLIPQLCQSLCISHHSRRHGQPFTLSNILSQCTPTLYS